MKHVVIVMHGIRDDGFWAKRISREIKTLYRSRHPGDSTRSLRTVTPSYGFFRMWDFLFPGGRTKALYWFLDMYANIRRLYPSATRIDLIAHSNGTYLGAQALRDCEEVVFRRMLFAGSVVRRDFWMKPIKRLPQRLKAFHNFIGREDLIVALLPGAMETIPILNTILNVGGAGAFGFHQLPPSGSQRMIRGGHGAAIQEDCWKAIASFIVEEDNEAMGDQVSMETILEPLALQDPHHPLQKVSRGLPASLILGLLRISIGALIVPVLLFLLLFPLWYPFLLLKGSVPAFTLPGVGAFPLMIPALLYAILIALVWILRNALRYL